MNVLRDNCLVLANTWTPIEITNIKKVIGSICVGNTKIVVPMDLFGSDNKVVAHEFQVIDYKQWVQLSLNIDQNKYPMIRTPNMSFFKPSVVVKNCTFQGRYIVSLSRHSLFARDRGCCQYCGKKLSLKDCTIDHVLPKSRGGKNTWGNIVISCLSCNTYKGNNIPKEKGMDLLTEPKKPSWVEIELFQKSKSQNDVRHWSKFISHLD